MIIFFQHAVHPGKIAFFNYLANHTSLTFKVYFLSQPAANRKWTASEFTLDFPYRQLKGVKLYIPGNDHSYFHFNFDIVSILKEDKAKMVISFGWNYLATWFAFAYCSFKKLPFGIISESTVGEPSLQRTLTKPFVSFLVTHSQILIGISTRAKRYLVRLGAKPKKVKVMLSTSFQPTKAKNQVSAKQVRSLLGIPKQAVLSIYVGQMIERKGVDTILDAAALLRETNNHFLLVGYGPMESKIQTYIQKHNVSNVHLIPYTTASQLWDFYYASDIFVLASFEETWGLVVNEAMEASLPILLSKNVGCSDDLLQENINGYSFAAGNANQLASFISKLNADQSLRVRMGNKSKEIISQVNPKHQTQTLLNEIEHSSV